MKYTLRVIDMQLGIDNIQTELEINNSAKKQENELRPNLWVFSNSKDYQLMKRNN